MERNVQLLWMLVVGVVLIGIVLRSIYEFGKKYGHIHAIELEHEQMFPDDDDDDEED